MIVVDPCSRGLLPVVISGRAVSNYDIPEGFTGSYVVGVIFVMDVFEAGESGGRKANLKLRVRDGLLREGGWRNSQGDKQECKRAKPHRMLPPRKTYQCIGDALRR